MDRKYYLKNIPWSAFFLFIVIYQWCVYPESPLLNILLLWAIVSFFLYPFAKKTIELVAEKFTSREFWYRGMFKETIGKNGLYIIYYALCFSLSIPVCLICLLFLMGKKAA